MDRATQLKLSPEEIIEFTKKYAGIDVFVTNNKVPLPVFKTKQGDARVAKLIGHTINNDGHVVVSWGPGFLHPIDKIWNCKILVPATTGWVTAFDYLNLSEIPPKGLVTTKNPYPHVCPKCKGPALMLFTSIECARAECM